MRLPGPQFVLNYDADLFMCGFPVKERTELNMRSGAVVGTCGSIRRSSTPMPATSCWLGGALC